MPTLLDYVLTFLLGPAYIFWRYPLVPLESIPDRRAEIAAIHKDIDRLHNEMIDLVNQRIADADRRLNLLLQNTVRPD